MTQRILIEWDESDDDSDYDEDALPLSRFVLPTYPSRGLQCDICDPSHGKYKSKRGDYRYGHTREECPINPNKVICTFCKGPHQRAKCQKIKTNICSACGLEGHYPSVCNKIKLGPDGQIGKCTYTKCKGKDAWGHFYVTCPRREAADGPYKFKPGEDRRKALAPPRPISKK